MEKDKKNTSNPKVKKVPGTTATGKPAEHINPNPTTEQQGTNLPRARLSNARRTPITKRPVPQTENPFAQRSKPYKNPVANPYRKEETEVVEELEPEEREERLRKYRFPVFMGYNIKTNQTVQIFRVNRTRHRGKPPFKVVHSKNDGSEDTVTYHPDYESANNHAQKVLHPVKEEIEQTNEAVLTLAQRIKRAQLMRREAPKIERAREIARTKFARDSQLKNRAEVLARRLVKKKFAGQRGYDYQKLSTSEKMAIDAMVDKKVALIHTLAKKLYPIVRRKEIARMLAYHKGINATPGASPVNLVNSYEPIQEKKFAAVPKGKSGLPKRYEVPGKPGINAELKAQFDRQKDLPPEMAKPTIADKTAKTKRSKYSQAYDDEFGDEMNEQIAGLQKKAKKSGISYRTLKKVYDRGMAAWRTGHRPGTTPQQWAFARVNSFITKGKTYHTADKDLHEEVQLNEWYIDTANKYKPSRGDSIVTNNGGRVFGRVERVDETSVYFRNQHDNRVYKTEINNVSKVDHWDGTLNENHMPSCPDYEEPKEKLSKRMKKALSETQRVADSAPELYVDPYTGLKKTRRYRRPTAVSTGEKL